MLRDRACVIGRQATALAKHASPSAASDGQEKAVKLELRLSRGQVGGHVAGRVRAMCHAERVALGGLDDPES